MIKLNKRQRQFVDNYEKYGGNYALVCEAMHIGERQYYQYMQQNAIKEYLACSMQRCKDSIIASLPHIQKSLLEMYNSEQTDDKIKVQIAKEFFDRAGLIYDRNVNINMNINTQITERAKQLLLEKQTAIETTAKPVTMQVCDTSTVNVN